jgi:putative flippase GtrA
MIRAMVRKHGPSFLRFAVCGGLGACVDFGTLHIMIAYVGWREEYALLVSTFFALCFVFVANRFFTFRVRGGGYRDQVPKFLMVYLTAAGLNYVIALSLIYVGFHYLIAKAVAIGAIMFFNYFLLRGFVFRKALIPSDEVIAG